MAFRIPCSLNLLSLKSIGFWRFLAIFFALLNLKHIPFGWHLRILTGLITHLTRRSNPRLTASRTNSPSILFQPLILSSRVQLLECDYNMHKSNSTYFSDFDIGRLHLLTRLFSPGLVIAGDELYRQDGCRGPKRLGIYLGGVSCNFRREIQPYGAFEIWTRVLCWDRKWLYVVTHFVRKGAVRPKGWTLQPWRNREEGFRVSRKTGSDEIGDSEKTRRKPLIFATGIAKYVAKRGRLTIPPERILQSSGLLPPKPHNQETTPPTTDSPAVLSGTDAAISTTAATAAAVQDLTSSAAEDIIDAALNAKPASDGQEGDEKWDWARVEQERQRGMKIMEAWNQTEALDEEFTGNESPALGQYWDFP
ncbi:MAG: hypothetical protein Q9201_002677 [Fulgogasparrea decipioides]